MATGGTTAAATSTSGMADGSETGMECQGCLGEDGTCQAGDTPSACGALGQACVACGEGTVCAEGSCVEPPACGSDNCDGCCDGDECRPGDAPDACGATGLQCAACPAGSACSDGACQLPCADSCTGCCDAAGACVGVTEQSAAACGLASEACAACSDGLECIEGACISAACAADCDGCCDGDECLGGLEFGACGSGGIACQGCADGTLCDDGGCVPDAAVVWDLLIIDAEVASLDEFGDAWDVFGGLPDPYARAEIDGLVAETDWVSDTDVPVWNELVATGLTAEALQDTWTLSVFDSDLTADTLIASCDLALPEDAFGVAVSLECSDGEWVAWTLSFQAIPSGP